MRLKSQRQRKKKPLVIHLQCGMMTLKVQPALKQEVQAAALQTHFLRPGRWRTSRKVHRARTINLT